ncbi:enoyl-CoA hydratase/isomerase family protein [Curvibacter sp. RS43]|uniref:enoyl-CoA hydratase/isomerase family protein n=1 Tax=Curvibacter microcysteis TaxID=3026419 RepID=UPI00235ECE04|nr:enoyl-CoA hydratase/isomerase family protein [Curvibacter sp. RS43]MDD0812160.1 enoyl-CoA hydratase/isomerase family protein [Curvibacter sp. RS43]
MSESLLITRQPLGSGQAEHWTLNDPASRNALSPALVEALVAACARAQGDLALRAIVLQGAGGSFCAGGSLGGFAQQIGQPLAPGQADPLRPMNRGFGRLLQDLCALPQILLAAVDGPAMGGGLGLVCCADWVLASPRAVFATPEVTLGIVPAQIAPFVQRRLGDASARRWLLSGQRVDALQAQADGLVHTVVDDLSAAVAAQLQALAPSAPAAVAATKRLLNHPFDTSLDAWLDTAAQAFAQSLRGPEAAAGLAAFAARRPAPWSQP